MKYMVSCRQPLSYLKNADEIAVPIEDIVVLSNFVDKDWSYPGDIIIFAHSADQIEWDKIDLYRDIFNIYIAIERFNHYKIIVEKGYKFFWSYPITSFWELNRALEAGVSQVILGAPLYFNLKKVKDICKKIEIRLPVNQCFNRYIPCRNGIEGTYIRPEDVEQYEQYVNHLYFIIDDLKKERALIKIYKDRHYWPGNLNLLLENLNYDIDNRAFDSDFAARRMNCGQICQENKRCQFCKTRFSFITAIDRNKDWLREQLD